MADRCYSQAGLGLVLIVLGFALAVYATRLALTGRAFAFGGISGHIRPAGTILAFTEEVGAAEPPASIDKWIPDEFLAKWRGVRIVDAVNVCIGDVSNRSGNAQRAFSFSEERTLRCVQSPVKRMEMISPWANITGGAVAWVQFWWARLLARNSGIKGNKLQFTPAAINAFGNSGSNVGEAGHDTEWAFRQYLGVHLDTPKGHLALVRLHKGTGADPNGVRGRAPEAKGDYGIPKRYQESGPFQIPASIIASAAFFIAGLKLFRYGL
jgi:hypothetical protein